MSKRKWEIRTTHGIDKVEGVKVLIAGYLDCIVHAEQRSATWRVFVVTELSTGCHAGDGATEKEAIIDAKRRFNKAGKRGVYKKLQRKYEQYGEVNQGVW